MLKKEDYSVIKALVQHGVYQKDIAKKLNVYATTINRALKRGSASEKKWEIENSKLVSLEYLDCLLNPQESF